MPLPPASLAPPEAPRSSPPPRPRHPPPAPSQPPPHPTRLRRLCHPPPRAPCPLPPCRRPCPLPPCRPCPLPPCRRPCRLPSLPPSVSPAALPPSVSPAALPPSVSPAALPPSVPPAGLPAAVRAPRRPRRPPPAACRLHPFGLACRTTGNLDIPGISCPLESAAQFLGVLSPAYGACRTTRSRGVSCLCCLRRAGRVGLGVAMRTGLAGGDGTPGRVPLRPIGPSGSLCI